MADAYKQLKSTEEQLGRGRSASISSLLSLRSRPPSQEEYRVIFFTGAKLFENLNKWNLFFWAETLGKCSPEDAIYFHQVLAQKSKTQKSYKNFKKVRVFKK